MKTIFLTGGTVNIGQMLNALVVAIEKPESLGKVLDVEEIRVLSI